MARQTEAGRTQVRLRAADSPLDWDGSGEEGAPLLEAGKSHRIADIAEEGALGSAEVGMRTAVGTVVGNLIAAAGIVDELADRGIRRTTADAPAALGSRRKPCPAEGAGGCRRIRC